MSRQVPKKRSQPEQREVNSQTSTRIRPDSVYRRANEEYDKTLREELAEGKPYTLAVRRALKAHDNVFDDYDKKYRQ